MTSEKQRHIGIVQDLSIAGGPLDKDGPHATTRNPAWYRSNGLRKAARRATHERLKKAIVDQSPNARDGSRALVLAGPPGAGKGRVADTVLGADRDHYVNVDADDFKKLLLREAVADGSYESWIKPPEVRDLEAKGERFYPLELASLVHEESSRLARELRSEMIDRGTNIIVDTVLSDPDTAVALGEQLSEAGYQVTVVDVEVPFEVSEERIVQRWQHAMQEAEAGEADALGGRWVPSAYARPLFDTEHGRSKSQDAAARLAESCSCVIRYERHYTSVEEHRASLREGREAQPVREVAKVRMKPGGRLEPEQSVGRLSE
ncbi:MAG: zeta toxin family protein [Aeromicrobium sp.]|uniref:zeta toxin family protein n=1 Tax=Aeromicrobium sp. TaxID=1871063 RepID=UPI0039E6BF8D